MSKNRTELEILTQAQSDFSANAIDPEKIRGIAEGVTLILLDLLKALKGNLTLFGIAFNAGKVLTAIRAIVDLFKKP
jgi:hypothetical protein